MDGHTIENFGGLRSVPEQLHEHEKDCQKTHGMRHFCTHVVRNM
jgi:hypothetical protein